MNLCWPIVHNDISPPKELLSISADLWTKLHKFYVQIGYSSPTQSGIMEDLGLSVAEVSNYNTRLSKIFSVVQ